jgi:hypothetical protein
MKVKSTTTRGVGGLNCRRKGDSTYVLLTVHLQVAPGLYGKKSRTESCLKVILTH